MGSDPNVCVGKDLDQSSLSLLVWNVEGLASKLGDGDFKRYVETFDLVCFVETFIDTNFDLTNHFTNFTKFTAPALKLSAQGRRSGGVIFMVKKATLIWR